MTQDLVPCVLVTFEKEQIVIWRGKNYKPAEGGYFLTERESYDDDPQDDLSNDGHDDESSDDKHSTSGYNSGDSDDE